MKTIITTASALAVAALIGVAFTHNASAADKAKKAKPDRHAQMDKDKDGKVTLAEFTEVMGKSKKEPKPTAEEIEKNFKRLDKDKSGDLNKEEVNAGGKGKGEKKPKTDA